MALHTGTPTTNIFQPGAIAVPMVTRQLVSDLQLLQRHFYNKFIEKYPEQDYFKWLETFAGMELTKGRDFYHYESKGKLMLSVAVQTAITTPAAGANVVITLTADSHLTANGTNYSPIRIGETIRLASNDKEGKIIAVNKTVDNAHTATIRPNRSDVALTSAGSANLLAGEVIKLVGNMDAGEASTSIDTQTPTDEKITNYISTMRDTYTASDLAEMEEIEYKAPAGDAPINTGNIVSAYTVRGMQEWNKRYMNNCSFKLMFGDLVTNTSLATSAAGTQGLIPAITARGTTTTYTGGGMTIAKIHEMLRLQSVNGGAKQIQWLQDIFQNNDFNDGLTAQYTAGGFVYGTGSASKEASVAFGFREFYIDGFLLQIERYAPFNTENVYGRTPTIDKYRDFGIMIPQGTTYDRERARTIPNLTIMYQEPPTVQAPSGSIGNGIRVWRHGGGSPNATNGTLTDSVEMVSYKGLRAAAMNNFQLVVGS